MYEMYDAHQADAATDNTRHPAWRNGARPGGRPGNGRPRGPRPGGAAAARALQVALDRRDNGGEAAAAPAE